MSGKQKLHMPVTKSPVLLVQRRCTSEEGETTFFSMKKKRENLQIFFSRKLLLLFVICSLYSSVAERLPQWNVRSSYRLKRERVETPNDCHRIKNIFLTGYLIFLIQCILLMLDWGIRKNETINVVFWDDIAPLSFQLQIYFLENQSYRLCYKHIWQIFPNIWKQ